MSSIENEADCTSRAQAGDNAALEQLLLHYAPPVSNHIQRRFPESLRSVVSVEDILQLTLIKAYEGIRARADSSPESFFAWLKTIADMRLIDAMVFIKMWYWSWPGGMGGGDVWFSIRKNINDPFESVQNLGASINTEFGEATLFLSADWPSTGSMAYFTSDRPSGIGGGDIWQASWVPDKLGDFDGHGQLDVEDLDRLISGIVAGENDIRLDVTDDDLVNGEDLKVWIKDLKQTRFGDANLDGEFSSGDLVVVFKSGRFELALDASWADGDWNGDYRFNSTDLVKAFQDGGYELGPRLATNLIPEPWSFSLLWAGLMGMTIHRRRTV